MAAPPTAPPAAAAAAYAPGRTPDATALLLLVPVVLGIERLNAERYAAQLRAVLRWPESVGVVGGRPGHSFYFIGYQVCCKLWRWVAAGAGSASPATFIREQFCDSYPYFVNAHERTWA